MSKKNGINRVCKCGKTFYVQGFRISDEKRGKFCSHECYSKNEIGARNSIATEFKKGLVANEKHPNWKGDKVGYDALHQWVSRNWGKAKECVNGHIAPKYEWSNLTGIYNRDRCNWRQLCISCHRKDDYYNPRRPII
jgi:hypothetical protein